MTIEQEILFIIDAKIKATKNGKTNDEFFTNLRYMFLAGDISTQAYEIAKTIYNYEEEKSLKKYRKEDLRESSKLAYSKVNDYSPCRSLPNRSC